MGAISSKSPLERRNTVARRSQRRTIHGIKAKVDKAFQTVKKFKGVSEEDANYKSLYTELEHIKTDLLRKSKDLQPQLRNIHENTINRIEEAFKALEEKVRENQEKAQKKEQEMQEKAEKKEKKKKEDSQDANEDNDVEVNEVEEEPNAEADNLENTTEKRKTVELKFVQIVPDDDVTHADVHSETNNNIAKSPEETRKSILKVGGVAVLPGAVLNEISARSSATAKAHFENDSEVIISKVTGIIEQLQAIEYQIADFVGRKYGTQYNRIRDRLQQHLDELDEFNTSDDYTLEQIKICKNYVGSCINFLDEKSIHDQSMNLQDDVFLPPNGDPRSNINSPTSTDPPPANSLSPVDARAKLQRLSKTTAI